MENTELMEYMIRNGIRPDAMEAVLYKLMLHTNFKNLCMELKRNPRLEADIRRQYRQSKKDAAVTKRIFREHCRCILSEKEAIIMTDYLQAYLRKKDHRGACMPDYEDRKAELLRRQGGKCACCRKPMDLKADKIHVDHIVPWVGDELKDNLQVLCTDCNLRKGTSVDFVFKSLMKMV